MGSEATVIRWDDTAQALGTETMRVRAVTYGVAGYVTIDAVNEAYWGIVRSWVDFIVIPWAWHPVYIPLP